LTKETSISLLFIFAVYEKFLMRIPFSKIISKLKPFIILTLLFFVIRYLITPAMTERFTHFGFIHLITESIKNILFAAVAFFFSLDFMAIKEIYRSAYPDFTVMFSSLMKDFPYLIPLIIISAGIFIIGLIKRNNVLTFSVSFIFVTLIPFMWLVGYERYLYLPSAGFAIFLPYFIFIMFCRIPGFGKYICISFTLLVFSYNTYNLIEKNSNWKYASNISYDTVEQLKTISLSLPQNSRVYFKNIPDNYKGCWIFREGIPYIPSLILNRKDMTFTRTFGDEIKTDIENKVYVYNYTNMKLILQ